MSTLKQCQAEARNISEIEMLLIKKPYVLIKVVYQRKGEPKFRGIGYSKCHPKDKWNVVRGMSIAGGRAIKDIARQLLSGKPRKTSAGAVLIEYLAEAIAGESTHVFTL